MTFDKFSATMALTDATLPQDRPTDLAVELIQVRPKFAHSRSIVATWKSRKGSQRQHSDK